MSSQRYEQALHGLRQAEHALQDAQDDFIDADERLQPYTDGHIMQAAMMADIGFDQACDRLHRLILQIETHLRDTPRQQE
ncbi:MAG: hypothetical protein Q4D87_08925 [Actinomycetaceae bacterium]|nr:hypothetical protein [Actinomycetaceae bacterium]